MVISSLQHWRVQNVPWSVKIFLNIAGIPPYADQADNRDSTLNKLDQHFHLKE